ncbi:MAG: hypothetical protein ACJ76B_12025 [Solirubrobacterales bacterium]
MTVLGSNASAADTYPAGGGQFSGGAEGWQVAEASCNVPVLCSAAGGYEGGDGQPAGSLEAETNIGLNLVSLFHSTVVLQSPDFEVGTGGAATLSLERRFDPGSLVDLAPRLDYTAQLIDRTSGKSSTSISGSIDGASGWSGDDGAATVQAGHAYAIRLSARTSSTVVGTGLLSGATAARFDNVVLTVGAGGAGGAGGGMGAGSGAAGGSISAERLAALAPATLAGAAQLKGNRLFVKTRCPAKVGRACRISVRGLLKKRSAATATRSVKVAKGKTRRLVLKVKPRAKRKVASRKRLLFKVRVRAGGSQATAFKRLRLLRR